MTRLSDLKHAGPNLRALVGRFAPALAVGALIAGTGAAQAGYFPTAWGWIALPCLWLVAIALLFKRSITPSGFETAMLTSLFLLLLWMGLSTIWTNGSDGPLLEVERTLVYLSAGLAFVTIARRQSISRLLAGIAAGITLICAYSLATRLFPVQFGASDDFGGYRLSGPLGYWNGLGVFAAMGLLLCVGLAARSTNLVGRCAAAASLPVLAATLYFTFSRGAWLALAAGLVIAIASDTRRLGLVTTLLALVPAPVVAIVLASRSPALVDQFSEIPAASDSGQRLAVLIVLLMVGATMLVVALAKVESRIAMPRWLTRAYAGLLVALVVAGLLTVFTVYGSPPTLAHKLYKQSTLPAVHSTNLNDRMFNVSSSARIELWDVAWRDFTQNPIIGSGAGTYESYWYQHRPSTQNVRNAHNLYLETMGELGVVGIALLAAILALPLIAFRRARREPLAAFALAAFGAYLVHAAVDWDWEMPAVTLVGLFCGLSLLVMGRRDGNKSLSTRQRIAVGSVVVVLSGFSLVTLIGNTAASASASATTRGDWKAAEAQARRAAVWKPWSAQPWKLLADAKYGEADLAGAAHYYRKAIAKDPRNWEMWFDLGFSLDGRAADAAFAQARKLNPRNPEIPR